MKKYPKITGESVWVTQMITDGQKPIKLVLVGVPIALSAVTASFITGKELYLEGCNIFLYRHPHLQYRSSRLKLRNSPYSAALITCNEMMRNLVTNSKVREMLLHELKEQGIPCIPAWCEYLEPYLKKWITPVVSFGVAEPMFLLRLPSVNTVFDELLMPHLPRLKMIAEQGGPA